MMKEVIRRVGLKCRWKIALASLNPLVTAGKSLSKMMLIGLQRSYSATASYLRDFEGEDVPWMSMDEVDFEEGDINIVDKGKGPDIELSEPFKLRLQKPWDQSAILKVLGRSVGYRTLCARLKMLWKDAKPFRLIDLENDFFLVQFSSMTDYLRALTDGPWTILGHCLVAQPWTPFRASERRITRAVVWVCFPYLPINWYHPRILLAMGNMLEDIEQRVCYEGLPQICYTCGRVGHNALFCPSRLNHGESADPTGAATVVAATPKATDIPPGSEHGVGQLGPWIHVRSNPRRNFRKDETVTIPKILKVDSGNKGGGRYATLSNTSILDLAPTGVVDPSSLARASAYPSQAQFAQNKTKASSSDASVSGRAKPPAPDPAHAQTSKQPAHPTGPLIVPPRPQILPPTSPPVAHTLVEITDDSPSSEPVMQVDEAMAFLSDPDSDEDEVLVDSSLDAVNPIPKPPEIASTAPPNLKSLKTKRTIKSSISVKKAECKVVSSNKAKALSSKSLPVMAVPGSSGETLAADSESPLEA
ncbi:hypothetical protein K2173_027401 [Erythroxylum novogranatense]|uniref:CCHC-type domain-containing protein n=1 Tax=Erythroxylum novogranatense TaxID=1862640 RepID=A0AAV8U1Y4_9ROSI|nr:hypothetical protein K2173_027401 [Erythroxylum novogranatense]